MTKTFPTRHERLKAGSFEIGLDGHLGEDMPNWISKIRCENSDWFKFCTEVNQFGEALANQITAKTQRGEIASIELLMQLLLVRSLSNFQGVLLLAERGMTVETATLTRSILENLLYVLALREDEQAVREKLQMAHHHSTKGFGETLIKLKILDPIRQKDVQDYLLKIKDERKSYISVQDIAAMLPQGVQQPLYAIYTHLSGTQAHPSIASLNVYLDGQDGNEKSLNTLPRTDVGDWLVFSAMSMIGIYGALIDFMKMEGLCVKANELTERYSNLDKKQSEKQVRIDPALLTLKRGDRSEK